MNEAIDRRALVARHDVRQTRIDPRSPVSVGNGEFAFTFDITGLQTFRTSPIAMEPERFSERRRSGPGTRRRANASTTSPSRRAGTRVMGVGRPTSKR
jgi:hypothetical protein